MGQPSWDPYDIMNIFNEDLTSIMHSELKENSSANDKIVGLFIVHVDDISSSEIHAKSLSVHLKERNITNKTDSKDKELALDGFVILHHKKNNKNESVLATHEKYLHHLANKDVYLHRQGKNNQEKVVPLSSKNIVYVGLNNAQYDRITSLANRILNLLGKAFEANKEKGEVNSLNGRGGHIKHAKHLKSSTDNVDGTALEVMKGFTSDYIRSQALTESARRNERVAKEKAQKKDEAAHEVIVESVKKDEMKREI
jgi:hypothetical protein